MAQKSPYSSYWRNLLAPSYLPSILLIVFAVPAILTERSVLEQYERQLNNLYRRLNSGKPMVINGKVKRYRCVEEYVFVGPFGNVIDDQGGRTSASAERRLAPVQHPVDNSTFATTATATTPMATERPLITSINRHAQTLPLPSATTAAHTTNALVWGDATLKPRAAGLPIRRLWKGQTDNRNRKWSSEMKSTSNTDYSSNPYAELHHREAKKKFIQAHRQLKAHPNDNSPQQGVSIEKGAHFTHGPNNESPETEPERSLRNYAESSPVSRRYRLPYPTLEGMPAIHGRVRSGKSDEGVVSPRARSITTSTALTECFHSGEEGFKIQCASSKQLNRGYTPGSQHEHNATVHFDTAGIQVKPPKSEQATDPRLQMTPENCRKLMSYAKVFDVSDVRSWVRGNCNFIQTFVRAPCAEINIFVDSCFPADRGE